MILGGILIVGLALQSTTALAAVQWYINWWNPILLVGQIVGWFGKEVYVLKNVSVVGEISWNRYMMDFYSIPTQGDSVKKIEIYTH